jgi:hypothetical protein
LCKPRAPIFGCKLLGSQGFVYSKFSQVKELKEAFHHSIFDLKKLILGLLLIAASREIQSIYPQKQSLWDCFTVQTFSIKNK